MLKDGWTVGCRRDRGLFVETEGCSLRELSEVRMDDIY